MRRYGIMSEKRRVSRVDNWWYMAIIDELDEGRGNGGSGKRQFAHRMVNIYFKQRSHFGKLSII